MPNLALSKLQSTTWNCKGANKVQGFYFEAYRKELYGKLLELRYFSISIDIVKRFTIF